ncbi:hypothetical protein LTR94_037714, partial [Friedmanniomyces endolithicus]
RRTSLPPRSASWTDACPVRRSWWATRPMTSRRLSSAGSRRSRYARASSATKRYAKRALSASTTMSRHCLQTMTSRLLLA